MKRPKGRGTLVVEKARAKHAAGISCAEGGCFFPPPPSAASFHCAGGGAWPAPAWRPQLGTETGQRANCEATGERQMDEEARLISCKGCLEGTGLLKLHRQLNRLKNDYEQSSYCTFLPEKSSSISEIA